MQLSPRFLLRTFSVLSGVLLATVLLMVAWNASSPANADPWSSSFTDINNAVIEIYSDSAYTVRVDQHQQLAANATYYVQVKHPNMNLNSEGANRRSMRIYTMMGTQTSFGNGSSEVTFTQQAGGPPYVYRASFRTPTSANVYSLEPDLRNDARTKRLFVRGWKISVGSTTSYVKTFSDAAYTQETDAFSAGARVYMEVYGSNLTDGTPTTSATTVIVSDFAGNQSAPSETVSRVSSKKYRVSFLLPANNGDKGIQTSISSGSVLARPDILVKVDSVAPTVSNIQPSGTVGTTSPTIGASYSDGSSGINTATVAVYLDGVLRTGCTVGASSVSCPTSGLAQGPHTVTVNVKDFAGNAGSATGAFTVSTCTAGKPVLSLAMPASYWASYADYVARKLSVNWTINNAGSMDARNVALTSSVPTYAPIICLMTMPVPAGEIPAGGSATLTIQYQLPPGYGGAGFRVANSASAEDCAGNVYLYGAQNPAP